MILEESVEIRTAPDRIFGFFEHMDENYRSWHPDHVLFKWVDGRSLNEGTVFYFEEYIAGKLLKKRVRFTKIEADKHIEFAPTFWLLRLFLPRFVFHVDRDGDHCRFEAQIHRRIGPLAKRLHQKDFDAVRQHMRDEGQNLKRLLEGN